MVCVCVCVTNVNDIASKIQIPQFSHVFRLLYSGSCNLFTSQSMARASSKGDICMQFLEASSVSWVLEKDSLTHHMDSALAWMRTSSWPTPTIIVYRYLRRLETSSISLDSLVFSFTYLSLCFVYCIT